MFIPVNPNLTTHYNSNGDVLSTSKTINGLTLSTANTYDSVTGLQMSETDSRENTTDYGYTSNQLLSYIEDANNVRTAYTYNFNGDKTSVFTDLDEDGIINSNERNIQYSYDSIGKMVSITVNGEEYTFVYNAAGKISQIKVGNTALVSYQYNPAYDRVISQTYANGFTKSYTYDILGNVKAYFENDSKMCSYQYDANNNLSRKKDYNSGLCTKYIYDGGVLTETKIFEFEDNDTLDDNDYASDNSFLNGYYEDETVSFSVSESESENTSVTTIDIGGVVLTYTTEKNDSGDILRYILPTASYIERTTDDFDR